MSSKHPETDLCQRNNCLEENINDLVSVSCTISSFKSFRAKIQDDFSDSDCENFDDCDSKRSTNSNAGQIDEKTFETTLDSTSLKKSNIETLVKRLTLLRRIVLQRVQQLLTCLLKRTLVPQQ